MRAAAAELLDRLDRDAAAATSYEAAAEAYQQAEWPMEELIYRRRAALSWHWATQPDQAETALAKADELVAALDSDEPQVQWERAMLGYDAARILAGQERLSEALSRILPVADGFRALGATTEAALATTMHGRLLVDLDKPDEAEPVLSQALAELPEDATQQREEVEALLAQLREHA
jgi:predicted Zn-dependent protease